jgi:hypothetical protein
VNSPFRGSWALARRSSGEARLKDVLPKSDLRDLKLRESFLKQLRWWLPLFGRQKKPYQAFLADRPNEPCPNLSAAECMQFAMQDEPGFVPADRAN